LTRVEVYKVDTTYLLPPDLLVLTQQGHLYLHPPPAGKILDVDIFAHATYAKEIAWPSWFHRTAKMMFLAWSPCLVVAISSDRTALQAVYPQCQLINYRRAVDE